MKTLVFLVIITFPLCSNGSEWMPYIPSNYPVIEVPLSPSITYSNIIVQVPMVRYNWVPVYYNKPVIMHYNGLFIKKQYITYEPAIEWVLQPIYYR